MKQTAVEWFFSELERMQYFIGNDMLEAYKQTLEMEKEQIEDAHIEGQRVFDKHPHTQWTNDQAEQYYNETYDTDSNADPNKVG